MRLGNFLQVIAIITLSVLSSFEYRRSMEASANEIYQLRGQKSRVSRSAYQEMYGPAEKYRFANLIEEAEVRMHGHWNVLLIKIVVVMVLALISVFHFIFYFHTDYDLEHEHLPMERYDARTWFLNFGYFAFVSIWYYYFSNGGAGAAIGYVLGLLCAVKCLWHITNVVRTLRIKKLKPIRWVEIALASLVYVHLIVIVFTYYSYVIGSAIQRWQQ